MKPKQWLVLWSMIGVGLGLSSCMLKEDIALQFPESRQKYIVECYLTPGQAYEASLMESNRFSQDFHLLLVWNADVYISVSEEKFRLSNLFYQQTGGRIINYTTANRKIQVADTIEEFAMQIITREGDTISARTEGVAPISLLSHRFENNEVTVSFQNHRQAQQRYYGLRVEGFEDTISHQFVEFFDYSTIDDDTTSISLQVKEIAYDSVDVQLMRITSDNYEFQRTVRGARRANVDPFANPMTIEGNITGGQGIFTYYTFDSVMLKEL